jgi:DNA-binding FadR family transcriptional regulator
MSLHNEKNLAERLEDAEATVREAIQWLKDGGSLDEEAESSANDAIQTIKKLRRACD